MEGNKKEESNEKVKIYDKDMYISQEKLKTIAVIIIIFIIGFMTGYFASSLINSELEDNNVNDTSYNSIEKNNIENDL